MIKNFLCLSFGLLLFLSCKEDKREGSKSEITAEETAVTEEVPFVAVEVPPDSSQILVEKMDSVSFLKIKRTVQPKEQTVEKITDFKTVKNRLNHVVEFDDSERYGAAPAVKKINFRNGTSLDPQDDFYEAYFVAYFPTEDILLCEGGHSVDVSFNLQNGKRTEDAGNPDEMVSSPRNSVRLNSHYGGQECSTYFIEKKNQAQFDKVVQLDEEFKRLTKHWLCTIGDAFWTDEKTLYVSETNNTDENGKPSNLYFKITLR